MTDAEIMKGVKLCNGDLGNCKECPFDSIGKTCGIELAKAEIGLIERLQVENAELRDRLRITKMALEYSCLESVQGNEKFLDELKEKVNRYIKQSEDVVYGQKNGVTFRFAEARLAELKGEKK